MTNETKQTAVEWYAIEMANYLKDIYGDGIINLDILKQAKEMFTKQIIDAHGDDRSYLQDDGSWKRITGEQYYNETYGGKR